MTTIRDAPTLSRTVQAAAIGAGTASVVTFGLVFLFVGHGFVGQGGGARNAPASSGVSPAPQAAAPPVAGPPAAAPAPADRNPPPVIVKYRPLSFSPLVHQVIPAVVNIAIVPESPDGRAHGPARLLGAQGNGRGGSGRDGYHGALRDDTLGQGSGFIVDSSGVIVTNRHVIGGAERVVVSLSNGKEMSARLLGADPLTDIAVIKVDSPEPLPFVTWGDSHQTDIGDWILVAGNPFGFGSSVTAGIVSAVGRDLGIGALDDFMQLDAPINPGNSGGPAFNMRGEVVAVNAAIVTPAGGSVGIGFGIPSEIVAPVVAQIKASGHAEHGWLGITLDDDDADVGIAGVDNGGPAQKSGLRRGDVVTKVDGAEVTSARMLLRSIASAKPGSVLGFTVRRGGKEVALPVQVGPRPRNTDD